jgi:hypothetical protein
MVRRPVKPLLLGRLARWLRPADWARYWSGLLSRQAERWTAAPPDREAAGDSAADETPPAKEGRPPAHWVARLQQSGQPLRWIEHRGGPIPYRPAGMQPPPAGTRGPGVSQPIPRQVETPDMIQPRWRAGTAPPAEDLPEAPSPQNQNRTQMEETVGRASLPHPRAKRAGERPARLIPRPRPVEKADAEAPPDQAPRPRFRLQPHSPEQPASQPPREAEAPWFTSGMQVGEPAGHQTERRAATAAARSEQPHDEAPALQQPVPPRGSPPQESRPESTTSVWGMDPIGEEGQGVDTHPLGPRTVEIPRHGDGVLEGVKESAQSLWPVLNADSPVHQIPADRAAESEDRIADMALNVHIGESVHLRAHPGTPTTDKDAARHRPTEERQLWEQVPPADRWQVPPADRWQAPPVDRWPALPESSYPGDEAPEIPEALAEETWNAQLRAWQRLRRLDEEQRGKPWNAWLF